MFAFFVMPYCGFKAKQDLPIGEKPFRWLNIIPLLAIYLGVGFLVTGNEEGWFKTSHVELVRNSSMEILPNVTIDTVLSQRFENAQWSEFQTDLGETIVQFDGTIAKPLQTRVITHVLRDFAELDPVILQKETNDYINALTGDEQADLLSRYEYKYELADGTALFDERYYLEGATMHFRKTVFPVGTPATIQWRVNTQNDTFQLSHMGSDAWDHMKDEKLLFNLIFGR